ncbi:PREDICTED: olfactory receptor 6B1-like [Nanorana parkeri]|uniref:olfactory receptor 6B1-like n=1 Tax=Nanorana parkeri TaxID=125878 RepID=UPI000854AD88|nr:PREDICTED: olfactory receptor 6B1-like [Nanorana parkeri]
MHKWSFWNKSAVTEFILVGIPTNQNFQSFLFFIFITAYLLTVTGNIVIITLIRADSHLHRPMYFFLSNFAFMQICYITVTVPTLLSGFLTSTNKISIGACFTQCYFFFLLGGIENFLLAIMAYDRYVAICHPLRYNAIVTSKVCWRLACGCWFGIFLGSLLPVIFLARLSFCGPNVINHYFCDISPLLKLSCSDTSLLKSYFFSLMWVIVFSCLLFTLLSYISIITAIFKIPSTAGRQKVFSTCGSHLTVVIIYFGAVIFMYVRPREGYSFEEDKLISVFYSILTPLLNPFIYCLRNKEIKQALKKCIQSKKSLLPHVHM